MPIYEYYCNFCDKTYEKLQKMNSSKKIVCPSCKGLAKRVISTSHSFRDPSWMHPNETRIRAIQKDRDEKGGLY